MARMYRSTHQPDYARKAEVVGNLSSTTLNMLGKLVYEFDDTTGLRLDPTNPDQGYISYYKPSEGGTDDYFNFGSASVDVILPLNREGTVVVNSDGKFYNNFIKIMSQTPDGDFEVYFTVFDSLDMKNANKSGMIDRLKAIITAANELSVTGVYNVAQGSETGTHVIIAMTLNENGTLHFISPTAQQIDSDADWTDAVTIKTIPIN